jgi:hypothetical protein
LTIDIVGNFEMKKRGVSFPFLKTSLFLRKIFKNFTGDRGCLPLKLGEFTCMHVHIFGNFPT